MLIDHPRFRPMVDGLKGCFAAVLTAVFCLAVAVVVVALAKFVWDWFMKPVF
jgi:hypothetical protein